MANRLSLHFFNLHFPPLTPSQYSCDRKNNFLTEECNRKPHKALLLDLIGFKFQFERCILEAREYPNINTSELTSLHKVLRNHTR